MAAAIRVPRAGRSLPALGHLAEGRAYDGGGAASASDPWTAATTAATGTARNAPAIPKSEPPAVTASSTTAGCRWTLFRQVGGSIGVAAFGAIFTNELGRELASRLPAGAHAPAHASPGAIQHLPAAIHELYVTAVAVALHPVFLTAAAVMVVGFGLSWRLRDVPLRETAGSDVPDRDVPADAYVGGASRGGSRNAGRGSGVAGAPATLRR